MKYSTRNHQQGFTLIELALAITFIGALLVFSTVIIVQSIAIYNKGIAVKQMNQMGRSLVDDLGRLSNNASTIEALDDNGKAGYLCIGQPGDANTRAYIWSSRDYGKGTNDGTRSANAVSPDDTSKRPFYLEGDTTTPISLARSTDETDGSTLLCGSLPTNTSTAVPKDTVSLLASGQVRVLSVDVAVENTGIPNTTMRKLTFWLGTNSSVAGMSPTFNSVTKTWSCGGGSIGSFCAVSKYETIVYTPNNE